MAEPGQNPGDNGRMTSDEAIQRAIDTAEGRLSEYHNLMLSFEADVDSRPQTLLCISQSTTAEVQKWAALAVALQQLETGSGGHHE